MIRHFRPGDEKDIAGIYRYYVQNTTVSFDTEPLSVDQMRKKLDGIISHYPCFVNEENGHITGYCYVHAWKDRAAYSHTVETTIYLNPDIKGKGIGKELMRHLIEECRNRGIKVLIACITAENEESCRFHEHLGFTKVSDFKSVGMKFGRLLDVVDYELIIA